MLVEQIDRIDIQRLGLRLYHLLDMLWPAVQALLLFGLRSTSKPNFVAMITTNRRQRLSYKFLVGERAIGLSRIEERDTAKDTSPPTIISFTTSSAQL